MGVSGGLVSVTHLNMAYHGPAYGLSRECAMKAQAKFSPERAKECMTWIEEVTGQKLGDIKDQIDFAEHLKDGVQLCSLINALQPGSVKKINTLKAPFKQRENIEMYLKACTNYGLKEQDLFQVNDLYENKNLYMVVDNLYALGGIAQKKSWEGPALGVKVACENKRNFDDDVLKAGQSMIGLQYGTNKGASQAGMTPYGASRQIRLEDQLAYKMNLAEHYLSVFKGILKHEIDSVLLRSSWIISSTAHFGATVRPFIYIILTIYVFFLGNNLCIYIL